jgi:hypothetical protein
MTKDIAGAVAEAKTLGLKYAACPWIPHNGDFDEATCRKAAADFNAWGAAFAKEGIKFMYHAHGYEFLPFGDGTLFGQHALAYAFLAYAAEYFRRRVLRFPLWQQAVQVAVLLGLCAALVLLVRFVGGAPLPRWTYFVSPLVGALVWPLLSVALQRPQRPVHSS